MLLFCFCQIFSQRAGIHQSFVSERLLTWRLNGLSAWSQVPCIMYQRSSYLGHMTPRREWRRGLDPRISMKNPLQPSTGSPGPFEIRKRWTVALHLSLSPLTPSLPTSDLQKSTPELFLALLLESTHCGYKVRYYCRDVNFSFLTEKKQENQLFEKSFF